MDWLTILSILGVGALVNTVIAWILQNRSEKSKQRVEAVAESYTAQASIETAHLADAAQMRQEIWAQLTEALKRNDQLSQELGESRRIGAEFAGEAESLQRQVSDLVQRLSSRDMQLEELKRKFTRTERQFEENLAVLNEHVLALQRHCLHLEMLLDEHGIHHTNFNTAQQTSKSHTAEDL